MISHHSYLSSRYKKISGYYLTDTFINPELSKLSSNHGIQSPALLVWKYSHHLKEPILHGSQPHSETPEVQTAVREMKMKAASNSSSSRDTLYFFLFSEKCNYQRRSWPHKWGLTLPSSYKHLRLPQMLSARFGVLCFHPKVDSV